MATGTDPRGWFDVEISAETLSKTNLDQWVPGARINLERALKVGDELGGHIVSGHVDGVATVVALRPEGESLRVTFRDAVLDRRHVWPARHSAGTTRPDFADKPRRFSRVACWFLPRLRAPDKEEAR